MIQYRKIHEIALIMLIIGVINIYEIFKNTPMFLYEILEINDKNILIFFLISILFFLIFFNHSSSSLEFELILSLGLIGLFFLVISKELVLIYLSLELYSLSIYLLLYKNNLQKAKITILYFLIGSISSTIILFSIGILYHLTGTFDLKFILQYTDSIHQYHNSYIFYIALALFFIGILFKIGAAPFQYWVIKIYPEMEIKILTYQSIIPKIFYIFFLSSFISEIQFSSDFASILLKLLLISSFMSLIIGSIGPLTYSISKFKIILAYSSILHVGFLLLGLASYLANEDSIMSLNILQYLVIYAFNTFHFFLAFLFLEKTLGKYSINKSIFFIIVLISIFSFIGLPPFAGFYAKLNIFLCSYFSNLFIFIVGILFMLIATIIATFVYLKFVHYFYFLDKSNISWNLIGTSGLIYPYSYLISMISIIIVTYPLILPYIYPIFDYFLI